MRRLEAARSCRLSTRLPPLLFRESADLNLTMLPNAVQRGVGGFKGNEYEKCYSSPKV